MPMTNVLIAILLLYNMWLVFYLLHEKRQERQDEKPEKASRQMEAESDTNIVGKSLFKMSKGRTTGDTAVPQATVSVEGEAIEKDDITFADESEKQPSMRLPDEELDTAFSDTRLSDVPVEYAGGEEEEAGEYASGATIEDMNEAIRTAGNTEATDSEKRKAGEVFHEMKGNELYETVTAKRPAIVGKIRELIDLYENKPTISKGGNKKVRSVGSQTIPVLSDNIDDFDIRDFV